MPAPSRPSTSCSRGVSKGATNRSLSSSTVLRGEGTKRASTVGSMTIEPDRAVRMAESTSPNAPVFATKPQTPAPRPG